MSVALNTSPEDSYLGDNSVSDYAITFPTFEHSNVVARVVHNTTEVITPLVEGVDYDLENIGQPGQEGLLLLIDDGQDWLDGSGFLTSDYTLYIQFNPVAFQPTRFRNVGGFAPEMFERALDRLTMAVLSVRQLILDNVDIIVGQFADYTSQISALDTRVDALETSQAAQDLTLADHEARLDALETAPGAFMEVMAENANFSAQYNKIHVVTGVVNAQLPEPETNGRIQIKLTGSGPVTLLRFAGEEIDTVAADKVLSSTRQSVTLVTDGLDWFII